MGDFYIWGVLKIEINGYKYSLVKFNLIII